MLSMALYAHPRKLGMPIMDGMGMSLTHMELGLYFLARRSREASMRMAAPKLPPAKARQYLGKSLDPWIATTAMLRNTGAKGALKDPEALSVLDVDVMYVKGFKMSWLIANN